MTWILSLLPRDWLRNALYRQWRSTLPRHERIRLDYWGTTGNGEHHGFQWADDIPAQPTRTDPNEVALQQV
jgi:hypothetical protein